MTSSRRLKSGVSKDLRKSIHYVTGAVPWAINRFIPKSCPECKSPDIHTETGREIKRNFNNGKLVSSSDIRIERRVFCNKCFHEFQENEVIRNSSHK